MSEHSGNPLLETTGLPAWDRVRPEHVEPAIRQVLLELGSEIDRLEASLEAGDSVGWQGLVEPLEKLGDRLERPWSVVGHLMSVRNSEPLREAHQAVQGEVIAFGLRVGQSPAIFRTLTALRQGPAWAELEGPMLALLHARCSTECDDRWEVVAWVD